MKLWPQAKRVYFVKPVGMAGPVKIGCSDAPVNRLSALMAWSPFPLEIVVTIPGNFGLERNIHECFASSYTHHEWFSASDRLTKLMADLAGGMEIAEALDLSTREGVMPFGKRGSSWTPDQKLRASYNRRIIRATQKLRAKGESSAWCAPDDVQAILGRWQGAICRGVHSITPKPIEIARLDEYLSDPAAQSVVPEWIRKKAAA